MAFETVPVVHVERRRLPEYPDAEPEEVLTALARAHERVALVDVAGIRRNEADLEFVQKASRRRSVWVDAGSRFADDAMDLFVAGAETVTLRWNTLDSVAELEEAAGMASPGNLFLGLEFPRGAFLRHPKDARDAAQAAALADSVGVGLVLRVEPEADLHRLPPSRVARYLQGIPRAKAVAAQELGFQGALLAPVELEAPE